MRAWVLGLLQLGRCWRWLIWAAYVLAWTTALLVPKPMGARADESLREALFYFAKSVHVAAYAVMTILTAWLQAPRTARWLLLAFLSGHALGTEYLQATMELGRTGSWRDVGLDHLGMALGILATWRWWRGEPGVSLPQG